MMIGILCKISKNNITLHASQPSKMNLTALEITKGNPSVHPSYPGGMTR